MIPLRDNNPTRYTPHVTWFLVAVNVIVFTYEVLIGQMQRSQQWGEFVYTFGAVPADVVRVIFRPGEWFAYGLPGPIGSLFTSMFVHGGIWHLGGNMLFLYIFGDNVEDEIGHVRFLIFYLLCGLAGALVHIVLGSHSTIPMVGASGAISGVMGAYILLYPRARVLTLVFFFFITILEIPAYWFLAIWFFFQFMGGMNSVGGSQGGVAFWAHVGGFLAGMWMIRQWTLRFRRSRTNWE